MKPLITAFKNSPDRGRGLARDFRVRWALEEVGQPYDVELLTFEELKASTHRASQPFGQIPTYKENDLVLFESGSIILYIAEKHKNLLPHDISGRTRAISWMFCALNTVEPPIIERSFAVLFDKEKPWFNERLPVLEGRVRVRLKELSDSLGEAEWLDGEFSVGDLMMIHVLRRLDGSGLIEEQPNIAAYIKRAEARPAYQRAFAAQKAVYEASLKT